MSRLVIISVVCSLCLLGCGKGDATSATPAEEPAKGTKEVIPVETNRLVTVDGKTLTRTDVERNYLVKVALEKLRKTKHNEAYYARLRRSMYKQAIPHYVQMQAYRKYCAENRVALETSLFSNKCEAAARYYDSKTYSKLVRRIDAPTRAGLEQGLEEQCLAEVAKKHMIASAKLTVSEKDLDEQWATLKRRSAIAVATNRLVYARATNVWAKIERGTVLFDEAADDYTEDEDAEQGGKWLSCTLEQLSSDPVLKALKSTVAGKGIGWVTPPVECDNGLCIVKVVKVSKDASDVEYYDLARIYFRLAEEWEVPTREKMRKALMEYRENEIVSKKLGETIKKLKITQYAKRNR